MFRVLIAAALAALISGSAQAASVSFGPVVDAELDEFNFAIRFLDLVTPTQIVGDATVTFSILGDLDSNPEYVSVFVGGNNLGRVFDGDTGNDDFDFHNDKGNQFFSTLTGSAIIPEAVFAPMIADGLIDVIFAFSPSAVDFDVDVKLLQGFISFDTPTQVPVPAALILLGSVLGAFGLAARRRKAKA